MNRQMPSKGRDPIAYNKAVNNVRRAKEFRKRVKGNAAKEALADLVVAIMQGGLPVQRFTRAGRIVGGKQEEWVLRA